MSLRELYEELGSQLGLTEQTRLVDKTRRETVRAVTALIERLLDAKDLCQLDAAAVRLIEEGERIRSVAASFVEDEYSRKTAEDAQKRMRSSGPEKCIYCGQVGEHICIKLENEIR